MDSPSRQACNIAIFASGGGSNAQEIINRSLGSDWGKVGFILTDNPNAGVIERAEKHRIPFEILGKESLRNGEFVLQLLENHAIDLIVLAGYLKLIPVEVVRAFEGKIINIHPALLPNYGGKGMYGGKVHEAVIHAKEEFSGITIHFVNERYDEGKIILQEKVKIGPEWDAHRLEKEIHKLEWKHFPVIVEKLSKLIQENKRSGRINDPKKEN